MWVLILVGILIYALGKARGRIASNPSLNQTRQGTFCFEPGRPGMLDGRVKECPRI